MKIKVFFSIVTIMGTLSDCKKNKTLEPFIVNGWYGHIENFPYAAYLSIECRGRFKDHWICGGSIINREIVLTAGHCVYHCSEHSDIIVSVGHEHIYKGFQSSAHSFIVHKKYNDDSATNDIGLVRLWTDLPLGRYIKRVALEEHPPYGEQAFVAGWGSISDHPQHKSKYLIYARQFVFSTSECSSIIGNIPLGTFCARDWPTHSYPSIGDSGSALVVRGYMQIGIVSYKVMKSTTKHILVYTDTGYFYKWIDRHINKLMDY